ncbi:MAG TPA: hypothetical protein VM008_03680 [Phycisphaerae bacterium]|nr:hypothetical protein [Phycisphaerae bacterium]
MKKSVMSLLLAVGLMGSLAALPTVAQQNNGGGGGGAGGGQNGGGGGGGGGGRFNFQQMMQRRMDQIKTDMGVSDDDWKAIEPKIQNVQQLQFQQRAGGFRGRGRGGPGGGGGGPGGGGGGPGGGNGPTNPVSQAMQELQTVLDNKDATPEQIKSRIDAVRDARKKAADELKKAQDDLRELLTVRQEAVLVENGLLD